MEQRTETMAAMENTERTAPITENKMGVMPINKLLLGMSVPMMFSMLVQALYNIVDSIFVARIGEDALTAVSLAFPLQSLMIALAGGTCVGLNAVLSKALGEKNFEKVNKSATNAIFLMIINIIVFFFVGVFAVKPFYLSQTQDAEIVTYGVQYLSIVLMCSFGIFLQFVFDKMLQSTGNTIYTMITQMVGAVINIVLDPILIFGLFGMPKMGVIGAAVATVAGQIIAAIVSLIFNLTKNKEVNMSFKGFKPDMDIIKQIYKVGVPSIIMQSIGSIMTYGMNQILIAFSTTATAVFGVYFKLQSFVFMPIFGLNNGMVPIVAYNYGAQKRKRLLKTVKLSVAYAVGIMTIGLLIFQLIPDKLFMLFDASEQMLKMGVPALRIISIHFPLAGICIVCGSLFQALGNAVYSMINSICRQIVVLLPAAYLLAQLGNVNYVWWSLPIAELMSLTMTMIFLVKINKDVISKIGDVE